MGALLDPDVISSPRDPGCDNGAPFIKELLDTSNGGDY